MLSDKRLKFLACLARLHFAYLVAVPLLGLLSWWFVQRSSLGLMLISGFAAIAAYYSLQVERYHLTTHLPSALWVIFLVPLLLSTPVYLVAACGFFSSMR